MKNKMTDEQIIKTLECCSSPNNDCLTDCPLYGEYDSCFSILLKPILDLINRLQAENEKLTKCQKEEIEKLMSATDKVISEAKAEAIREFAERLKEKQQTFTGDEYVYKFIYLIEIDNLVKEMVGEE